MLSRKAKYALRALSTLALAEPAQLQARRIAQEAKVPEKFLEAILVELRNAGVIESRRGTVGGHRLARPADELMVGDIVRIIDGPIAPIRCASVTAYQPCADCIDPPTCALRELMVDVRDAMSAIIDKRSLRELAQASIAVPPSARAG